MKKIFLLIAVLALAGAAQAKTSSQRRYISPEEVHVTVSPAAQQKADALYESVRKAYAQGSLTPDAVVDKALYHKVWSPQLAAKCLSLVADKSDRAKAELGFLYAYSRTAYMFPGKEAEGVSLLQSAASSGSRDASDYLGIYYASKDDYAKALKAFNAAGSDHLPLALTMLGGMYADGHGVKKDRTKALDFYRRAAQSGNASGAQKYGAALQKQWYGKVNMPDAFVWTYIAGDLGSDFARTNLQLPLRGERFGDDKQTAFMLNSFALTNSWNDKYGNNIAATPIYKEGFKQGLAARDEAAEKGDPWSLFYLGSMSYNDEFLNRNYELVRKCYEYLIDHDTSLPAPAMALVYERMADMYRHGHGVTANASKADKYERKAADLGSLAAYKIVEKIPD